MKTIYNILNFPILFIFGFITAILCIPFLWDSVVQYGRKEIGYDKMMSEITFTLNNFPILLYWLEIPLGIRALINVAIATYILY